MNSRQRRKMDAQQHNDAIAYENWLLANTLNQTRIEEVKIYQRERSLRINIVAILGAISALGIRCYAR